MDVSLYVKSLPVSEEGQIQCSRSLPSESIPQQVKTALDAIFSELMDCKPSWRNAFKTKEEAVNYKKALGVAMASAKIDSYEKARYGIAYAQLDESPFFPSVGMFVKWCKDGYNEYLTRKQLEDNTKCIMDEKRQIGAQTWEERQKTARSELSALREIIKSK